MPIETPSTRRRFLSTAALAGGGLILTNLTGSPLALAADPATSPNTETSPETADITPAEDLMFEHGLIERILLIYNESARRIEAKLDLPAAAITATAELSRKFNEDYHEKLEEREVFPRFEKAGQLVDLVKTLKAQHDAGRKVTDVILQLTKDAKIAEPDRLAASLRSYSRMFFPHLARENSVLFRAFQSLLPEEEYEKLGDQFEEQEHKLVGEDGFKNALAKIVEIEKQLNIYELDVFTPKV